MKKILALLAIVSFIGCNKNENVTLRSSDKSSVIFTTLGGPDALPRIAYIPTGGLADEYISFDDLTIKVKFDGPVVAPADITVTYKVDAAALTKYNADHAADPGYRPFALMPDSCFSLLITSDVIKKGEVYAPKVTNNLVTHPDKIDKSTNYIIPITVSNSLYPSVSGGSGTIFYSVIGNVLAGKYTWRYRRWQSDDTTTVPLQDVVTTTSLAPISSSKLMTRETYTETFIDPPNGVVLGFTETGGVLGSFGLSFLPSTVAAIPVGGFILLDGPKFTAGGFKLVGSAATNYVGTQFATYIKYQNSTPAFRTLVNEFTKIP